MELSNSASDEHAVIFIAQELEQFEAQPDSNEELQIRKLPFSELYQMVQSGEILDSLTVAAVLKVELIFRSGELSQK